mmetsp:Transcript_116982/g.215181  ORF Transcript_116982/g.215181 Transcript_116982/m.215181 type:complete len:231 (+) Transcript_116982:78-770(+)
MAKKRPASALEAEVVEVPKKLKLLYFDIKGKGHPIRLLCRYAGLPLEDYRFSGRDEFLTMKESGQLRFGQVPALEIDNGQQLVQTAAIMRYLAKLKPSSGLYPQDLAKAAIVDGLMDQVADASISRSVFKYSARFGLEGESWEKAKETLKTNLADKITPTHLRFLEKMLSDTSTGWLADTDQPTIADFYWATEVSSMLGMDFLAKSIDDFPKVQAFIKKFTALPALEAMV